MTANWFNIEKGILPEIDEPVFVAKAPTDDLIKNCQLARLFEDDNTGENSWFVDVGSQVINLHSRNYWTPLTEKCLSIPDTKDENVLKTSLTHYLVKLGYFEKKFQKLAASMVTSGNGMYAIDFYISGILSRCLSLIYGFEKLIPDNYIAAAHLVRPHLDTYLRLSAAWLVEEPHEFAQEVMKGGAIRDMKDRNGVKMTDTFLRKKASKEYPWINDVYRESSGFIHFSKKHIWNATSLHPEDTNSFVTALRKNDNNVSYHSKLESTLAMIEISNCIATQVYGWIATKSCKG